MPKLGKRTIAVQKLVDSNRHYGPAEALALAKETATAKFDETIEVHLTTTLDGRHADQQLRGSIVLPHGLGKAVRVVVFAEGEAATDAMAAGAEEVGSDDLIKRVSEGFTNFDVALAQRELMGKVGGLGRILGPRGLMPNPRNNTVLAPEDIGKAVTEALAGRIDFRLDRTNLVHSSIGKASFSAEDLLDNMRALVGEIVKSRPTGSKGQMLRGVTVTATMGPGINVDIAQTLALATSDA